jgi:hypothetical protein
LKGAKVIGSIDNVHKYPQYLLRGVQKVFPTDVGIGTCLLGRKLMFVKFEPQRYCGFPLFEIFAQFKCFGGTLIGSQSVIGAEFYKSKSR